jgi:hypothetical protein
MSQHAPPQRREDRRYVRVVVENGEGEIRAI